MHGMLLFLDSPRVQVVAIYLNRNSKNTTNSELDDLKCHTVFLRYHLLPIPVISWSLFVGKRIRNMVTLLVVYGLNWNENVFNTTSQG